MAETLAAARAEMQARLGPLIAERAPWLHSAAAFGRRRGRHCADDPPGAIADIQDVLRDAPGAVSCGASFEEIPTSQS